MKDSPRARHSQPDADCHAWLDVARRPATMDCCRQPGDREAETMNQEAGGAVQDFAEGHLVAREIGDPWRLQLI